MEKWKPIIGYEEYEVSDLGRLRKGDKIINCRANCRGYVFAELHKNWKRTRKALHRLVAIAFIPNEKNLPEINHIDENKTNNCVTNLEWVTHHQNCLYGTRNARISRSNSKRVVQIKDGEIVNVWKSAREAGENGYTHQSITLCCNGKARMHKGYKWEYA